MGLGRVEGKVARVTSASGGIGREIALTLASDGRPWRPSPPDHGADSTRWYPVVKLHIPLEELRRVPRVYEHRPVALAPHGGL